MEMEMIPKWKCSKNGIFPEMFRNGNNFIKGKLAKNGR